jgi:hypothetical protein
VRVPDLGSKWDEKQQKNIDYVSKAYTDLLRVAIVANRLVEKWWDNEEPMRSVNRAALRHHLKSVQHLIPEETESED